MQNYTIPPLAHIDYYQEGTAGFFCLAQLYKQFSYYQGLVNDLKSEGVHIILDNGAGDHDPISNEELFDITCYLMPDVVIPVDVLFDAHKTLTHLDDFISWHHEDIG